MIPSLEGKEAYTKEQIRFLMNINNQPCLQCDLTLKFCKCKCFMSMTDDKALNQCFEDWEQERKDLR